MAEPELWANRTWTDHRNKHAPPQPRLPWPQVVAGTDESQGPAGVARYHPQITRERWRAIELRTIEPGAVERAIAEEARPDWEIPTPEPIKKRRFAREVGDLERGGSFPLGASEGEETNWVYVEWQANPQGVVHGRPILESRVRELRRKAAKGLEGGTR